MNPDSYNLLSAFGLTREQLRILFSVEYLMANNDLENTRAGVSRLCKKDWLANWKASVELLLNTEESGEGLSLLEQEELCNVIQAEIASSINHTWYHLVLLEAVAFEAYTPLGASKEADKEYRSIKYAKQLNYLSQSIVDPVGVGSATMVDSYDKAYRKALATAAGKNQKIITGALVVIAASALIAATAGALAAPIAVSIVGSQFATLYGAALTSACLAALGGGAVAAGGMGVAGGTMVLVGGGALLGAAGSGAAVIGASALAKSSPDFAISQGAKLTVVLREIILNGQNDIMTAQAILENFKMQIGEMHKELAEIKLQRTDDKQTIQNLTNAIEALERLYSAVNIQPPEEGSQ